MAKGKAKKRVALAKRKDPLERIGTRELAALARRQKATIFALREQCSIGVRFDETGAMFLYISPKTVDRLDKVLDGLRPHLGPLWKRLAADLERELQR